jgi:hypothetical protein
MRRSSRRDSERGALFACSMLKESEEPFRTPGSLRPAQGFQQNKAVSKRRSIMIRKFGEYEWDSNDNGCDRYRPEAPGLPLLFTARRAGPASIRSHC